VNLFEKSVLGRITGWEGWLSPLFGLSGCNDKLKFVGQSRAIIQFKAVEAEV
jgi:hypothetical protein